MFVRHGLCGNTSRRNYCQDALHMMMNLTTLQAKLFRVLIKSEEEHVEAQHEQVLS